MRLLDLPPTSMAAALAAIAASQRVTLAVPVIGHTRVVAAQPVEVAQ